MGVLKVTLAMLAVGSVAAFVPPPTDPLATYVETPNGYAPQECVYSLPEGHEVEMGDEGELYFTLHRQRVFAVPKCERQAIPNNNRTAASREALGNEPNGWQADAHDGRASAWTAFNGSFTVPNAPTSGNLGQILYIFTALQNACSGFDIIQPVLQYGTGPAGGGGYWSVANWYILGGNYVHTTCVKVASSGKDHVNTIQGSMWVNHTDNNGTWVIKAVDSNGVTAILNLWGKVKHAPPQMCAFCTMETYRVPTCKAYPTMPVKFSNLVGINGGSKVGPGQFKWMKTVLHSECNQQVNINGDDIEISW